MDSKSRNKCINVYKNINREMPFFIYVWTKRVIRIQPKVRTKNIKVLVMS